MNFARDEGGATAVEFAMMLPIFLTLVFGIVVFGSYFAMIHGVQRFQPVRPGCRSQTSVR